MKKAVNWSSMKFLIVDDMDTTRQVLKKILNSFTFEYILEAQSGNEAWRTLKNELTNNNKVDLIISDINMPDGSGLDFLQQVKKNEETMTIPFLLLSTEKDKAVVLKAISLGADNYIIKPFDNDVVKRKLLELLDDK